MLFNSLTFVVFFTLVLAGYWSLTSWNARKNLLLVASYIFYGAWNPPFALLLFATTALDFVLGAQIAQASSPRTRRGWLIASVAVNLSMLGFFTSRCGISSSSSRFFPSWWPAPLCARRIFSRNVWLRPCPCGIGFTGAFSS